MRCALSDKASSMTTVNHSAPSTQDALALLRADHLHIERVLADCERLVNDDSLSSQADRSGLVARLGALLQAHLRIKSELFEPAFAHPGNDAGQDAGHDHDDTLQRLAQLNAAEAKPGGFAAALAEFADSWRAHVANEEGQQLPSAQRAAVERGIDLLALGTAMAQRRGELLGDQGVD